jgi:hypothetical protein
MIVVSSHKPGHAPHHSAQLTWAEQFDFTIYLGPTDKQLAGPRVAFTPAEPFPKILEAVKVCALQPGWSAIVNADIHMGHNFRDLEKHLVANECESAVSGRYQFNLPDISQAIIEDMGIDLFAARQNIWNLVQKNIPEMFRFGHVLWDTWLLGFFMTHCDHKLADLTPWRTVFHPRHPQGNRPYAIDDKYRDPYILKARWPLTQHCL